MIFNLSDTSAFSAENELVSKKLYSDKSISQEYSIPLIALKGNSSLQAIVLYLKNVHKISFSEIARLLGRDPRTIWTTYENAKKSIGAINYDALLDKKANPYSEYNIPLNIFSSRNMSVLESIVFHMKVNYGLSTHEISLILNKNYRTIWTVYKRAIKKLDNE